LLYFVLLCRKEIGGQHPEIIICGAHLTAVRVDHRNCPYHCCAVIASFS